MSRSSRPLTFFPAETVQAGWSRPPRSRAGPTPPVASPAARAGGANNVADGTEGLDRLAELCDKVIQAADGSDAPLFAGWRTCRTRRRPDLVVHRMSTLRELPRRIAAIRQVGLDPATAFMVRTPLRRGSSAGRSRQLREIDKDLWQSAEDLTERAFAADLAVLDDDELAELCRLSDALLAAIP